MRDDVGQLRNRHDWRTTAVVMSRRRWTRPAGAMCMRRRLRELMVLLRMMMRHGTSRHKRPLARTIQRWTEHSPSSQDVSCGQSAYVQARSVTGGDEDDRHDALVTATSSALSLSLPLPAHPRMSTALVKGKLKAAREAIQAKDYGKAEKAARCAK